MVFVALSALLAWSIVPADGILRHPETGLVAGSPFLKSIVVFIFLLFALPGIVYGRITRSLRGEREVVNAMAESMSTLGLYLVIIFFAAQFVAFFNWTNIGQYIAVKGAVFLKEVGLACSVLFIGFILICAFINLMIGSASAQWAVTAPIFVPMLMLAGYAPEVIQAAYRIGDSVTNIITPMMSYFGLIMATVMKYKKDAGVGTLISMMLPYSAFFLIAWIALFCIWVFVLACPLARRAHFVSRTLNTINKIPSENLFSVFRRHLPFHPVRLLRSFPLFPLRQACRRAGGRGFQTGAVRAGFGLRCRTRGRLRYSLSALC